MSGLAGVEKVEKLMVSPVDAAKMLGLGEGVFYRGINSGRIPLKPAKIGGSVRYSVEQIKSFCRTGAKANWRAKDVT